MGLIWYAALGGGAGSAVRFLVTRALQGKDLTAFPTGTLVVNVAGSLLIGALLRAATGPGGLAEPTRVLLVAGFCGGFTTFSAFSIETLQLMHAGDWRKAALNVALSVALSIGAAALGFAAARQFIGARAVP